MVSAMWSKSGSEHSRERPGHLVLERELDRAGLRRERLEAPGRGEMPERSLQEAHVHGLGRVQLVPRAERLVQAAHSDAQRGLHPPRGALVRPSPRGTTGRKRGYDSMSSTSANICSAECSTIADRAIRFMGKSRPNVDRREPQGVPRLFHRGALRGRHRARGLGGEGDPRRPRQHRRGLRHGARRRALSLRRAREPAADRSTHSAPDPTRTRKLLLRAEEIRRLIGKVEQRGYTLVPLNLHYSKGRIKLEVGLGRGKLKHDKRADQREKEWNRRRQRLLRSK
jgi:hypothetical protein